MHSLTVDWDNFNMENRLQRLSYLQSAKSEQKKFRALFSLFSS